MTQRASTQPESPQARKREAILRAASSVLNRKGYAGMSLAEVAEKLGMTNAALYYYFENKEELVFQCILRSQAIIDEALASADAQSDDGLAKVKHFVRAILALARERGALPQAGQLFALSQERQERIRLGDRAHRTAMMRFIEEGIEQGVIEKCNPALADAMIFGWLFNAKELYRGLDTAAVQTLDDETVQMVTRLLASA